MTRPFLISLICWFLILWGSYTLVKSFGKLNDPATQAEMEKISLPVPVQVGKLYVGLVIVIASAIFMYEGSNIARFVYIGWGAISLITDFVTAPVPTATPLLIELGIYLVVTLFLLLPFANRYFRPEAYYEM